MVACEKMVKQSLVVSSFQVYGVCKFQWCSERIRKKFCKIMVKCDAISIILYRLLCSHENFMHLQGVLTIKKDNTRNYKQTILF